MTVLTDAALRHRIAQLEAVISNQQSDLDRLRKELDIEIAKNRTQSNNLLESMLQRERLATIVAELELELGEQRATREACDVLRQWASAPNDATAFPWWAITVESKIGYRGEIVVAGPFFSREKAQTVFDARFYCLKDARVYCFTGHESNDLRTLYRAGQQLAMLEVKP